MRPLNIFIVEDEIMYACLLQYALSNKIVGNVSLFESYAEMKPFLEDEPDFIILDYNLDSKNGLEIQEIIKEEIPETNVIFVSGTEDDTIKKKALQAGAFEFIGKDDFTFLKLECMINNYTNQ